MLNLPLEIRQKIYKCLLVSTRPLYVGNEGPFDGELLRKNDKISLTILHVCNSIRSEAGDVFYINNRFAFSWRSMVDLNMLSSFVPSSILKIQHLKLVWVDVDEIELFLSFMYRREELYHNLLTLEISNVYCQPKESWSVGRFLRPLLLARGVSSWRPGARVVIAILRSDNPRSPRPPIVFEAHAGKAQIQVSPLVSAVELIY